MKRILLVSLIGLCLCACNNRNNKVVDKPKYNSVSRYSNVTYFFDGYMRCCVHYVKFDDNNNIVLEKDWKVYLTGYYYYNSIDSYTNVFYECKKATNNYDYYLLYNN